MQFGQERSATTGGALASGDLTSFRPSNFLDVASKNNRRASEDKLSRLLSWLELPVARCLHGCQDKFTPRDWTRGEIEIWTGRLHLTNNRLPKKTTTSIHENGMNIKQATMLVRARSPHQNESCQT